MGDYDNTTIPFLQHRHECVKTLYYELCVKLLKQLSIIFFLPRCQDDSSAKGKTIRWILALCSEAYLIQEQYMGLLK